MNQIVAALAWLADGANWSGSGGIIARTGEHLWYSVLALALAAVVAVPLGMYIGHTGRGRTFAVAASGAVRALPSLGLLTLLAVSMGLGLSWSIVPSTIVLALLAVPSLLAGTYSGFDSVADDVVDGARATGFSELQIVSRVELPLALPLMVGGLRAAALQVIATATISAYIGLGGLGRFILDGLSVSDYPRMLGGAIAVGGLALAVDLIIQIVQRTTIPRGVHVAVGPMDA
ncbi:ABC transporter permease subunit [Tessaracoccus sp. OS52]|uniref:ABC transporter permease n=1 Tax=Tessaracoccus sp. OS52 TaxID=2886691 RepID=UPI001D12C386|nr:ABC transporter permease subunit [Tessaracoccus sp. OS52]MCC2593737.1 ABC transporter permease subunit [Tessaracoccus sp. OS52]